jgi:hypothetical protein
MQTVKCPNCDADLSLDRGRRAGRGQLRMTCDACGHRFAIQVQKRELRLGQDVAVQDGPPPADDPSG